MTYYQKSRLERYRAALAGCSASRIEEVEGWSDGQLTSEAVERSGLGFTEFAEDVLFCDQATLYRYRMGQMDLPPLLRAFLRREMILMLERISTGTIPGTARCAACGRGQDDERPLLDVQGAPQRLHEGSQSGQAEVGPQDRDELGDGAVAVEHSIGSAGDC